MVQTTSQQSVLYGDSPVVCDAATVENDRRQLERLRSMRRSLRPRIERAMHDERVVVRLSYLGDDEVTVRFVSPIRFLGKERFLAYCLSREEPRQFYFDRCLEAVLMPAAEVSMPMPLTTYSLRDNDRSCC